MSAGCGNPDCLVHGQSEGARRDRDLRQQIVTNHELMSAIRLMACNVVAVTMAEAGIDPFGPIPQAASQAILEGSGDDDASVRGIINGLVVLMRDHGPTQSFADLCSKVPESDNYMAKIKAKGEVQMAEQMKAFGQSGGFHIPGVGFAIPVGGGPGGLSSLLEQLFGQRGRRG